MQQLFILVSIITIKREFATINAIWRWRIPRRQGHGKLDGRQLSGVGEVVECRGGAILALACDVLHLVKYKPELKTMVEHTRVRIWASEKGWFPLAAKSVEVSIWRVDGVNELFLEGRMETTGASATVVVVVVAALRGFCWQPISVLYK